MLRWLPYLTCSLCMIGVLLVGSRSVEICRPVARDTTGAHGGGAAFLLVCCETGGDGEERARQRVLEDPEPSVRMHAAFRAPAARFLGRVRDRPMWVLEALDRHLDDPDARVARLCREALGD